MLFCRPSELHGAKWAEFDFDNAQWNIPEERMKKRREHVVPLSTQALAILKELKSYETDSDFLFPHRLNNKEVMRSGAILAVIKRSGYAGRMTTHRFRSLFSTVLIESNLFNFDAIERQLAHVSQNRIRSAYNRAQFWDMEKEIAYQKLCDEENLKAEVMRAVLENYEFTKRLPRQEELMDLLNFKVGLFKRESVLTNLLNKTRQFIEKFYIGV